MKKLIVSIGLLFAILALPSIARAQCNFATVTGTITDPNGLAYSGATIQAQIVPSTASPTCGGGNFNSYVTQTLNVSGSFTFQLAETSSILPSGTQWQFSINFIGIQPPLGTGPQYFTYTAAITGNVSLSAPLSALAPALSHIATGVGSVTNVSAGNLSPLFTTAVTNPGSTPSIAYTLANVAAETIYGNCSTSTAAPAFCQPGIPIDAQTGTSYIIPSSDYAHVITFNNSAATAITGPALSANISFGILNLGAGLITYTPASGNCNGSATCAQPRNWYSLHYTDDSNEYAPIVPTQGAFPTCPDSAGNHLNFSGDVISCGTSSSGGAGGYAPAAPQTDVNDTWAANNVACVAASPCPFVTHVTFTGAATSGTVDGTHVAVTVRWLANVTGSNSPAFTFNLSACPAADYTAGVDATTLPICSVSPVVLWTTTAAAANTSQISTGRTIDIYAQVGGTAGTFEVAQMSAGQSSTSNGTVAAGSGTIACGSVCSGGSWVIYPTIKYSAATSGNTVTTIGFYVPFIY